MSIQLKTNSLTKEISQTKKAEKLSKKAEARAARAEDKAARVNLKPSSNFGREFNIVLDADELPEGHPQRGTASYTQYLFQSMFAEPKAKEEIPPSMADRILVSKGLVFDPSTGKTESLSSLPPGVKILESIASASDADFFK